LSRFLIVRLGSLGDVVHAIPFLAALRAHYRSARIDWLVDPQYTGLLEMVRGLDRAIGLDPRGLLRRGQRVATLRLLAELRREKYDVAFDLQGLVKSALLARAAGARRVVGFPRRHLREPLARAFYSTTADPGPVAHVIDRNLALLTVVDIWERRARFPIEVPASSLVDAVVERYPGGYVLLNPGAAWPNKRWPAACFGAVAAALKDIYGTPSLVLWGPGERPLAQEVVDASGGAAEAAPPTRVQDLAGIARSARLMISGDTGPLHVAAAVGTPAVALFGPTRPERNGPWALYDVVISRNADCICHYQRRCRRADPCIATIGVDEVLAAVARRLDSQRRTGS
jgi:lipopolysaccharide heptosyltransferase I